MFPNYISELLKAYFEMSSEDRRKILNKRYFDTNPLTCLKEYLPYLALEVGVNIDGLSEKEARIAINEAINALNYKGTAKSFKSSLKPYTDAKVKEWYEYDGKPYRFKAVLSPNRVDFRFDEQNYQKLTKVIEENKNVRSILEGFEFKLKSETNIKSTGGVNVKTSLNKEFRYKNSKNFSIVQTQGINTKLKLNRKYRYKEVNDIKINAFEGISINAVLNKEYNYKQEKEVEFKNFNGINLHLNLNKNDTKIPLNSQFNLDTKGVSDVYLASEINLKTLSTKFNVKGAVVWLV